MRASFDRVTSFYDILARIVFFGNVRRSQLIHLNRVTSANNILVLGGGTGWIIKEIYKIHPQVKIVYVESSERMIQKSRQHIDTTKEAIIQFHQVNFQEFESDDEFDVVLANYFLDVFNPGNLTLCIKKIMQLMKPEGRLIVTDFQDVPNWYLKVWQRPLLWLMHRFFRVLCGLESHKLQNIHAELEQAGLIQEGNRDLFHKMIFTRIYRKGAAKP